MELPGDGMPPQNIDAEQAVLGSVLVAEDALYTVDEVLQPQDFYREAHRHIFGAMRALYEQGEPVDTVTVSEELQRENLLERVGGLSYLTALAEAVPTAANAGQYARIVEEKALLRSLIRAAGEMARHAYEADEEVEVLLDEAEQAVFNLGRRRRLKSFRSLHEILLETYEHIEYLYENKGTVFGLPTGFEDLDNMTSGLQESQLVILAARPSQGKTALALNMAREAAVDHGIPVGFFSLEMSRDQVAQRLICSQANVDSQRVRTGFLTDDDWEKITHAVGRLSEAPMYIDDTPNLPIMELRARARRMKAEHDVGVIVVDYLQLMNMRGRVENRQQEISTISRSLKALARELEIPIMALSQLSRAVEQRPGRRPQLSDLRESGAIEQDADVVIFIHRDPEADNPNIVELVVAKQRNGPIGSVKVLFLKEIGSFVNLERVADRQPPNGTG